MIPYDNLRHDEKPKDKPIFYPPPTFVGYQPPAIILIFGVYSGFGIIFGESGRLLTGIPRQNNSFGLHFTLIINALLELSVSGPYKR